MNNPFENLLTLEEATKEWGIKDSDILENILDGVFVKDRDVKKIENTWLISINAMNREYGKLNQDPVLVMSNMPYATMSYEAYIRNAFECERNGDPAGLANGDIFDMAVDKDYFYKAKAAVSYAAIIYNNRVLEEFHDTISNKQKLGIQDLAIKITESNNKAELYEYMDMHNNLILNIENKD